MSETQHTALLPAGLSDGLPPDAAFESEVQERLMAAFESFGYERIKPPLIEFEEGLLSGLGTDTAAQTFRLMDPISQRMMGVRADMTPQAARIAATRLKSAPRPLRLSYSGQVLRVKGSQLRPERQFTQVGAELIGADETTADAEVILMAADGLAELGIENLSVDLCIPTLVPRYCAELGLDERVEPRLRDALDRKDAAAVSALEAEVGKDGADVLNRMLAAAGPAAATLSALSGLPFGAAASAEREALENVVSILEHAAPDLTVTVDPVENRGFEYHSGVTFTFFARGVRGELGTGGRYVTGNGEGAGEPSTGFTLFLDTVLRALARSRPRPRVFAPLGTPRETVALLRGGGWAVVCGLAETSDPKSEAARLACTHVVENDEPTEI